MTDDTLTVTDPWPRPAADPVTRFVSAESTALVSLDAALEVRLMAVASVDPSRITAARPVYDGMRVEAIAGQFLDILGDCTPRWTVEQALPLCDDLLGAFGEPAGRRLG